jgi:predicted signal transduction protein with EAL and GGDEF domain
VSACLERADAALYKAKKRGDGAIVLFGPEDEVALQHRSAMTRRFNACALDDRLCLLYQPFYDVDSRAVVGFEAFARWSPDGQAWLAPGEFLACHRHRPHRRTDPRGGGPHSGGMRCLARGRMALAGPSLAINLPRAT